MLCEKRDTAVRPWLRTGTWPSSQPCHTNPCELCWEKQPFPASYPPTFSASCSPRLPLGSSISASNKHLNSLLCSCTPDLEATPTSPPEQQTRHHPLASLQHPANISLETLMSRSSNITIMEPSSKHKGWFILDWEKSKSLLLLQIVRASSLFT